ncbi:fasciclin domain-containing protein [Pontibacter sp. Tf4]|uniref:fasciclin domain-containing protein n=1 Tax=Pontibacter sp. Tf4 TaxID=2761620 RepID=UPI001625F0A5|nr:fasciclin domain-containing protein [Pontibacter sp. Tf4]MBB6610885.1 fasciclin domain-containing protein [Pontibacter sp. Tf4]
MKTTEMKSLAAIAVASLTMFGCASSNEGTTAMDDNVTMSETQTMAGTTEDADDADAVVVTAEVVEPVAVVPIAALSLTNTEDVNDMFDNIEDTEAYSLMDLAQQSPNLSTFVQLMNAAGLADDFEANRSYTIFAPTNEAFSKLDKAELEMLLLPENKAKLASVLMVHILPSEVTSANFNETQRIDIGDNRYIPVSVSSPGRNITVGGANVVVQNVEASNGVIHVIDHVIIPKDDAVEGDGIR